MKKVINGSRYNTDTAKKLANWESDQDYNGLYHEEEALCRTKAGNLFLWCSGGAASRYGKKVESNRWTSGEMIQPVSEEDARKWAEEKLDGASYDAIFGEVGDNAKDLQATVRIPAVLAEKLMARMDEENCNRNDLILKALRQYLL